MGTYIIIAAIQAAVVGALIGYLMDCSLVLDARTTVGTTDIGRHLTACLYGLAGSTCAFGLALPGILYADITKRRRS